jgi:hypothetical protein
MWANDSIYYNKLWATGHVKVTKNEKIQNMLTDICEHFLNIKTLY